MAKDHEPLRSFTDHGLEFYAESGSSIQTDCPFCDKERAFNVNPKTTLWICSSSPREAGGRCGRSGNAITFLEQWAKHCWEETTKKEWSKLRSARDDLPVEIWQEQGWGWNPLTRKWILPVRNERGGLQDLRRWSPGKRMMGTSGCKTGLWGAEQLGNPAYAGWDVDICEGEWDAGVMRWMNRKIHRRAIVVGVPGARTFKKDWVYLFKGRNVIWWFDNDADGIQYSYKRHFMLKKVAKSQKFVTWPDTFATGFDVRDFAVGGIVERELPPSRVYYFLRTHVTSDHQLADLEKSGAEQDEKVRERPKKNPTFEKTHEVYARWLKMTRHHTDALKVCYATVLANHWPGVPVWGLLVGPPGIGKTELLMSLQDVPEVMLESSVGPKTLISGFKGVKEDEDPSLIPKMLNKTTVFKDWTEILDMSENEQRELYKTLRGAFDGHVIRHYGNGVERSYRGRFGILGGVTNKVHGQSRATVGERFLKFQMPPLKKKTAEDVIRRAITSSTKTDKQKAALSSAALAFLDRDVPDWEPEDILGSKYISKTVAVSQLIAILRHDVEWENLGGGERGLKYKPQVEIGTRIAQQLTKFAMAMCIVDGKKRMDDESWRLVERLAFNTGIGFNLDVVEAIMAYGGVSCDFQMIRQVAKIPSTSLRRKLEDLEVLGVLKPEGVVRDRRMGRPPTRWRVSSTVIEYWRLLKPKSHIKESLYARARDE